MIARLFRLWMICKCKRNVQKQFRSFIEQARMYNLWERFTWVIPMTCFTELYQAEVGPLIAFSVDSTLHCALPLYVKLWTPCVRSSDSMDNADMVCVDVRRYLFMSIITMTSYTILYCSTVFICLSFESMLCIFILFKKSYSTKRNPSKAADLNLEVGIPLLH